MNFSAYNLNNTPWQTFTQNGNNTYNFNFGTQQRDYVEQTGSNNWNFFLGFGGADSANMAGSHNQNYFWGGAGADYAFMNTNNSNHNFIGGLGNDFAYVTAGKNTDPFTPNRGDFGNNNFWGGQGNDTLFVQNQPDMFFIPESTPQQTYFNGGEGYDTAILQGKQGEDWVQLQKLVDDGYSSWQNQTDGHIVNINNQDVETLIFV